jgi:hypothetical protein
MVLLLKLSTNYKKNDQRRGAGEFRRSLQAPVLFPSHYQVADMASISSLSSLVMSIFTASRGE